MTKIRNFKVALALPDSKPWGITPFFNGVNDYAREHRWLLTFCPVNPESIRDFPLEWFRLKSWRVDGIILHTADLKQLMTLRKLRIPMVNISQEKEADVTGIPRVGQNNRVIGQLAFEHLIELGLNNFAYHGVQDRWYSDERLEGFKRAAEEWHLNISSFCIPQVTKDELWNERYEPVKCWLKKLPLPVGLFAVNDFRALIILSACREIGLRVPEDVAVIGVDNDLMVCEFSIPTLTSVCVNAYRMGFEAARVLDGLMHDKLPPRETFLIDPTHVVARHSTDVLHIADPIVKRAVEFMQQHFFESFNIDKVAEVVGVSRRLLEMRLRAELETSPAEFLVNLRLKKAKAKLIAHNRQTTEEIARACGFGTGKNLRAALLRIFNVSPNDIRPDKGQS